ncbi:MAG: OB-fold domain-containing protein [Alphaproteobacteria bacterium]
MTDFPISATGAADPTTEAFWAACQEHRLTVQSCRDCGGNQMYPRGHCVTCGGDNLEMVDVSGRGEIYSLTTVRIPVTDDLTPPYFLALVDLDEGPRLLTNIVGESARIGDRVAVEWRARDGLPPIPVFRVVDIV